MNRFDDEPFRDFDWYRARHGSRALDGLAMLTVVFAALVLIVMIV